MRRSGLSFEAWLDLTAKCRNYSGVALLLKNLSKTYPRPGAGSVDAVKDVTLALEEGELMVLVGPSGCGKTTTLRLIAGLEEPSSGTILIDGKTIDKALPAERDIAMVFQNGALYPHLTARHNMAFGLKVRRHPKGEIQRRVSEAAELLGLTEVLDCLVPELSGGQRQRVALGRAIVRQPRLFLLDEPLSNLDSGLRAQLRAEIGKLHARLGATMLYVTHDQVEAITLGQRLAVMNKGELQQVGPPEKVYRLPANRFVAGFIGWPPMNLVNGCLSRKENSVLFTTGTERSAPPVFRLGIDHGECSRAEPWLGKPVVLGLRSEDIHELPVEDRSSEYIDAAVEWVQNLGSEMCIYARLHGIPVVFRSGRQPPVNAGQTVRLVLDVRRAHFFDPVSGARISQLDQLFSLARI